MLLANCLKVISFILTCSFTLTSTRRQVHPKCYGYQQGRDAIAKMLQAKSPQPDVTHLLRGQLEAAVEIDKAMNLDSVRVGNETDGERFQYDLQGGKINVYHERKDLGTHLVLTMLSDAEILLADLSAKQSGLSGTMLLKAAIQISCALAAKDPRISELTLTDDADIDVPRDAPADKKQRWPLYLVQAAQYDGESWYSRYGFQPKVKNPNEKENMKYILSLTFEQLEQLRHLDKLQIQSKQIKPSQKALRKGETIGQQIRAVVENPFDEPWGPDRSAFVKQVGEAVQKLDEIIATHMWPYSTWRYLSLEQGRSCK